MSKLVTITKERDEYRSLADHYQSQLFELQSQLDEIAGETRMTVTKLYGKFLEHKMALELACVEIAQLNIRGEYINIIDKVMPEYWLEQVRNAKPCSQCESPDTMTPSHNGSHHCENGSIAAGGTKTHCTCDNCY